MDGREFDAMTRVLARVMPRRGAFRTLTSFVFAGATASIGLHAAEANPGGACIDEKGEPCSPGQCCYKKGLVCRHRSGGGGQRTCGACISGGRLSGCVDDEECCSRKCEEGFFSNYCKKEKDKGKCDEKDRGLTIEGKKKCKKKGGGGGGGGGGGH